MTSWEALGAELDRWKEAGRTATLWWRDDDAFEPTEALDRLVDAAGDTPVGLAVIPKNAGAPLVERLAAAKTVWVLQHGYRHRNHEPEGERPAEFGSSRIHRSLTETLNDRRDHWSMRHMSQPHLGAAPRAQSLAHDPSHGLAAMLGEMIWGHNRLGALFGERYVPAFVAPWNRLAPEVRTALHGMGYRGLSLFGERPRPLASIDVPWVNTHVDVIRWRGERGFVGTESALAETVSHLERRRTGEAPADEPTGLLTHHLVMDDAAWDFVIALKQVMDDHPAARWLAPPEVFAPTP